jgi:TonB family protein
MLIFRFFQGIGTGGEVPVASAYINEFIGAKKRGRFFLLYELIFPIGLLFAGLAGYFLVPLYGWRALFIVGLVPAVLMIPMRALMPESPRWLASMGRIAKADKVWPNPVKALFGRTEVRPVVTVDAKRLVAALKPSAEEISTPARLPGITFDGTTPQPVYPAIAQSARVSGTVTIEATIGPDGKVTDATVVRSVPMLDQAALDAVRQWEYLPTLLNGVPVPVVMSVTVNFKR